MKNIILFISVLLTAFFSCSKNSGTNDSAIVGVESTSAKVVRESPLRANSIKKYKALLTQSGLNAPVATVLNSGDADFLGNIVWTRDRTGTYLGTLQNAFPLEKTFMLIPCASGLFREIYNNQEGVPSSVIVVTTALEGGFNYDGQLYYTPVLIEVYP